MKVEFTFYDINIYIMPWILSNQFVLSSGSFALNVDDNAPPLPDMAGPDQVEIKTFICAAHCTETDTTFLAATVDDQVINLF